MKLIYCFLLGLNLCAGCGKKTNPMPAGQVKTVEQDQNTGQGKTVINGYSYLALGDSYTIGESVSQEDSFPHQLTSLLAKENKPAGDIKIIARTGWTTNELQVAIKSSDISTRKYDIVTLLIGVNNQYRNGSIDTYRKEFAELLNTAIAFADGDKSKVFVLSIPDWGVTRFANGSNRELIAGEIDQFNAVNREESLKALVDYTDITAISRKAASEPDLIATDGLHPSKKMYELWARALQPKITGILK